MFAFYRSHLQTQICKTMKCDNISFMLVTSARWVIFGRDDVEFEAQLSQSVNVLITKHKHTETHSHNSLYLRCWSNICLLQHLTSLSAGLTRAYWRTTPAMPEKHLAPSCLFLILFSFFSLLFPSPLLLLSHIRQWFNNYMKGMRVPWEGVQDADTLAQMFSSLLRCVSHL